MTFVVVLPAVVTAVLFLSTACGKMGWPETFGGWQALGQTTGSLPGAVISVEAICKLFTEVLNRLYAIDAILRHAREAP